MYVCRKACQRLVKHVSRRALPAFLTSCRKKLALLAFLTSFTSFSYELSSKSAFSVGGKLLGG